MFKNQLTLTLLLKMKQDLYSRSVESETLETLATWIQFFNNYITFQHFDIFCCLFLTTEKKILPLLMTKNQFIMEKWLMIILYIKCSKCLQVLICLNEHTQVLSIYVLHWKTKQEKELMLKCSKMLMSFWTWLSIKLNHSSRTLSKDIYLKTFSKENSQANWSVLNADTSRPILSHFMFWLFQSKDITIYMNLLMV